MMLSDNNQATQLERLKLILANAHVLLVGGDKRNEQAARLQAAFGLSSLEWIATRETDPSSQRFAAAVSRPEVNLVVALVGLVRHQHIRDLRRMCRQLNKPLVLHWRTPHPIGLAESIATQAGVRLAGAVRSPNPEHNLSSRKTSDGTSRTVSGCYRHGNRLLHTDSL